MQRADQVSLGNKKESALTQQKGSLTAFCCNQWRALIPNQQANSVA